MNSSVRIRKATEADAPAIASLLRTSMAQYAEVSGIPTMLDAQRETEADILHHIQQDLVLVAETPGSIDGTVRLRLENDKKAYFSRFAVAPNRRKTGIGKHLLMVAVDLLSEAGADEILLHTAISNQPLVALYTSQGFELVSVSHDRGYARGLFRKVLRPAESGQKTKN